MENKNDLPSLSNVLKIMGLIILFSLMFIMYKGEKNKRIEQELLIEASNDELVTWKNKAGENLAKIQVLETQDSKTFLAFQTQNETIKELQTLVKANMKLFKDSKGSASIIKTETVIDATGETIVDDSVKDNPIYKSTIENEWYNIKTVASKDSTNVKINTFHTLSLVVGSESQGLFKKSKPFATVKDSNPYSNIKEMRVYNVSQDRKNFVVGPYVGAGLNVNSGIVNIGWQAGVGIMYKFKEF